MDHFMVSIMVGVTSYNKNEIQYENIKHTHWCRSYQIAHVFLRPYFAITIITSEHSVCNEFMVSITSFKSFSTRHGNHFVRYDPN